MCARVEDINCSFLRLFKMLLGKKLTDEQRWNLGSGLFSNLVNGSSLKSYSQQKESMVQFFFLSVKGDKTKLICDYSLIILCPFLSLNY